MSYSVTARQIDRGRKERERERGEKRRGRRGRKTTVASHHELGTKLSREHMIDLTARSILL